MIAAIVIGSICLSVGFFFYRIITTAGSSHEDNGEDECLAIEGHWIDCNTEIIFDNVQLSEN